MMTRTTIFVWTVTCLALLSQTAALVVIRHSSKHLAQHRGQYVHKNVVTRSRSSYYHRCLQVSRSTRSSLPGRLFAPTSSSSSSATTSTSSQSSTDRSIESQRYKNFLPVEDCINLYNENGEDNCNGGNDDTVHFLDVTWFHKGDRNGRKEFSEGPRIKGSNYFDIMDIAMNGDVFPTENPNKLYTMFPPVQLLTSALDKMGIPSARRRLPEDVDDDTRETPSTTTIIIYGRSGTLFAPRVWYMLKKYFENNSSVRIRIMDGPFEEWIDLGGPVDTTNMMESETTNDIWSRDLVAEYLEESSDTQQYPMEKVAQESLVEKHDVLKVIEESDDPLSEEERSVLIIDTRGSSFQKKGHIPSAIHVPYSSLTLDDNPLRLKPREELKIILKDKIGFDPVRNGNSVDDTSNAAATQKRILLTCGSAVSVCHMALVLDEFGYPYEPLIYDGSWNEWGSDPSTPKVV